MSVSFRLSRAEVIALLNSKRIILMVVDGYEIVIGRRSRHCMPIGRPIIGSATEMSRLGGNVPYVACRYFQFVARIE